jgi:hypothetical protein
MVFMLVLIVAVAVAGPLALLTALGAHRRGLAVPLAAVTGLLFPVTWTVWYVRDERPYRGVRRHLA